MSGPGHGKPRYDTSETVADESGRQCTASIHNVEARRTLTCKLQTRDAAACSDLKLNPMACQGLVHFGRGWCSVVETWSSMARQGLTTQLARGGPALSPVLCCDAFVDKS